ncbi:hypothetical protein TB2_039153 [Malus domestica]
MAASERRCHYEVLGLPRDSSADEIRSAYRKLALQCHPDKLVQSGLSQSEATAQFQELAHAYEVLSDPKERAWYDSHRSQILFSDRGSAASASGSGIPNLFPFFSTTVFSGYSDSGRGFYKVYSDVFDKIYANELNFARKLGLGLDTVREAPAMGNLESPYAQVTAFYNYWAGFCTVMDFCWEDMYDVLAGPNRKSRRLMEEENKKVRKKAKREFNETKFKSEKQWKNHEQSKKHRDKIAEFQESVGDEELEVDDEDVLEGEGEERGELGDVDELGQEIREGLKIGEEEDGVGGSDQEDELRKFGGENGSEKVDEAVGLDGEEDEDEMDVLEAMVTGRKSKKKVSFRVEPEDILVNDIRVENDDDDAEFMEYNNRKSARRKGGARKERSKKNGGEANNVDKSENNGGQNEESNEQDNSTMKESTSHSVVENESIDKGDELSARKKKSSSKAVDKKEKVKKEANDKSKNSSKGKKAKVKFLLSEFAFLLHQIP